MLRKVDIGFFHGILVDEVSVLMSNPSTIPAVKRSAKAGGTLPTRFTPRFLADADRRIAVIRGLHQRIERLKKETGADSYQKELLVERAVFITAQLETNEVMALEGEKPLDVGSHIQATNCLIGLLKSLGLERKAKRVTSLKEYVKSHTSEDGSEDET
jgi:hypothetical protein